MTSYLPHQWPYPRWIAHRGAGKLAPENTLAALRTGAAQGYRMFECDVKLSADNIPFLLHDAELQRTTNASGIAGSFRWAQLAQLDAGSWHSDAFAGEPIPTLETIANFCRDNQLHLNIEIKPTPGSEMLTGALVAQQAATLWTGSGTPPLLSSFDRASLAAAQLAAPQLPRALLLGAHGTRSWAESLEDAHVLGCVALVCHHAIWNAETVETARAYRLRCMTYTVNDTQEATRLLDLGLDGIITDRVDLFAP